MFSPSLSIAVPLKKNLTVCQVGLLNGSPSVNQLTKLLDPEALGGSSSHIPLLFSKCFRQVKTFFHRVVSITLQSIERKDDL
jgi:hypothetical protein